MNNSKTETNINMINSGEKYNSKNIMEDPNKSQIEHPPPLTGEFAKKLDVDCEELDADFEDLSIPPVIPVLRRETTSDYYIKGELSVEEVLERKKVIENIIQKSTLNKNRCCFCNIDMGNSPQQLCGGSFCYDFP